MSGEKYNMESYTRLQKKCDTLKESYVRLQSEYRNLEHENESLRLLLENKSKPSHVRRLSSDPLECQYCGKVFDDQESKLRHQRRSKICQKAQTLPETTDDIIEETMRCLHGVVVNEN